MNVNAESPAASGPGDRISVILVTQDSALVLDDCLRHLALELQAGGELVVVDNGSRDGSADRAGASWPGAIVIRNARNRGYAAACNQGVSAARGDWLVLLNPDVRVDPGSLAELRRALRSRADAGVAAARLRSVTGRFQASCRRFPTRRNLGASRGSVVSRWRPGGEPYTLPDSDRVTAVPAVACAFVMLRRELFLAVGGFDERFFMFMEDTDLSLRLQQAGRVNLFVPAAGATHLWGRSSRAGRLRRAFHHHHSVWQYFRKHEPGGFSWFVLPALLAGNLIARVVLPADGEGGGA